MSATGGVAGKTALVQNERGLPHSDHTAPQANHKTYALKGNGENVHNFGQLLTPF